MTDIQKEQLEEYFKPIYYVELEETVNGELFPHKSRWAFYNKRTNKQEALKYFASRDNAKRVIEKNMYTGKEKVIKEKEVVNDRYCRV